MDNSRFELIVLPGRTPYGDAHRMQLDRVARRKAGEVRDALILLQHPPVVTLGRNADTAGVVASDDELSSRGISVHRIERGGQATYHGPGQIVGYPIIDLHGLRIGVARYVHLLEQVMIDAAGALGVEATRREGITGIFATGGNGGKIGAIGVRVTRGVTYHGFAFNVDPDLTNYQLIVPCGMTDTPVTSIAALTGSSPGISVSLDALVDSFQRNFEVELGQTGEGGPS